MPHAQVRASPDASGLVRFRHNDAAIDRARSPYSASRCSPQKASVSAEMASNRARITFGTLCDGLELLIRLSHRIGLHQASVILMHCRAIPGFPAISHQRRCKHGAIPSGVRALYSPWEQRERPMPARSDATLKLDAATKSRLQRLAAMRHHSTDRLVREAIDQYLEREEARESFRRDTLDAWAEYQATGQHLTAAEVDAWLARLETGEDAEPPPPHS
jgi:predicted transcriptional regulator